jgi:RNA polymerase sigma-70 factor (ECF subfamily)
MKEYQKTLFPYAYNILGSAEDARDAVQDVLSNYIAEPREGITNEKGYLIKSVINHAINIKNRKKKIDVGDVWLPEPFATEEADTNINLRDIASYSMLVLLEQLNPKERAVFLLKESFDYSHQEIAEVLSSTEEHSRKLLSRAKAKLEELNLQRKASAADQVQLSFLEKYINAIRDRDTQSLETILAEDISFYADGGKLRVVRKSAMGAHEVADLLVLIHHRFHRSLSVVAAQINHQPALLYYHETRLITCQILGITPGSDKIYQINTVVDPEKLKHLEVTGIKLKSGEPD